MGSTGEWMVVQATCGGRAVSPRRPLGPHLTALFLALVASAAALAQAPRGTSEHTSEDGVRYILRKPGGWRGGEGGSELWMILHGGKDTPENLAQFWLPLPELREAALVLPALGGVSVGQLRSLLDELEAELQPAQVYLTGFSAGASLTYNLGLAHPDRFAGLMPYSGVLRGPVPAPEGEIPIFHVHGEEDASVPASAGATSVERLREAGYTMVRLHRVYNAKHILREYAVAPGIAWLRAHAGLPRTTDPAVLLAAAGEALAAKQLDQARVLLARARALTGQAPLPDAVETRAALEKRLDTEVLRQARALARRVSRARNAGWRRAEQTLRILHPTAAVLEVLDGAVDSLRERHDARAGPLHAKGLAAEARGDYHEAMVNWAQIQQQYYLSRHWRTADEKINQYWFDPEIRAKLKRR